MKIVYIVAFLLISISCSGQGKWTLVYENDLGGNSVQGDLTELIKAIQSGQSVRIYFKMGRAHEPEVFVEHTALAKYTTIMNSPNGQFVAAQIDPIIGQIPDFEKGVVLLKENLEWSLIASTNGRNDTMTRNVITGEVINHSIAHWGTKWFILKH